jgi:hypothetical protein
MAVRHRGRRRPDLRADLVLLVQRLRQRGIITRTARSEALIVSGAGYDASVGSGRAHAEPVGPGGREREKENDREKEREREREREKEREKEREREGEGEGERERRRDRGGGRACALLRAAAAAVVVAAVMFCPNFLRPSSLHFKHIFLETCLRHAKRPSATAQYAGGRA